MPFLFPSFLLNLAKKHGAVVVSPNYTLMPHHNGLSILHDDVASFDHWLMNSLVMVLRQRAPHISLDTVKLIVAGASAGGYMALSHGLVNPTGIRALCLLYPMIDFDTDVWVRGTKATGAPNPFRLPDNAFPSAVELQKQINNILGSPVSTSANLERAMFGASLLRVGMYREACNPSGKLDDDSNVWLNRRVEAGEQLPGCIWLLHGANDTAVPPQTSVGFANTMERQGRPIRLDIVDDQEHGFDVETKGSFTGPEDPLLVRGSEWVAESWLS